jgi:hypothetical protein
MSSKKWLSWMGIVAVTAMAAGCAETAGSRPPPGGQIGGVQGEGSGCRVVTTTVLGVDDVSPLGFSASQLLTGVGGQRQAPLTWKNGQSTTLTLEPGAPQAVRFVELEIEEDDSGADIAPLPGALCNDRLEIDAPLGFATADGKFAESFNVTLRAEEAGSATFDEKIDLSTLQGSYQLTDIDASQFDAVDVYAAGTLSASSIEGSIHAVAESVDDTGGPDGTASATFVDLANY